MLVNGKVYVSRFDPVQMVSGYGGRLSQSDDEPRLLAIGSREQVTQLILHNLDSTIVSIFALTTPTNSCCGLIASVGLMLHLFQPIASQ